MSEEKRDLEFYLANPDQMPADMGQLSSLMGENSDVGEVGANELAPTGEQSAASGAAGKEKVETGSATVDTAVATGKEGEQGQQVLKSKDGKHEIPYAVLQGEREGRRAAEQAAEQMRQRVAQLEEQVKTGTAATTPKAAAEPALSDEELAQIENDFPAVGKLLKGMAAQVGQLTTQLQQVTQSEHGRRQAEASNASTTVQEAIDNSGHLSYWQQKDPEMFDIATKFDNQIKSDPRNKGLSLDQRFERVVKAVEAVYGATELPAEFQRTPAASPAPAPAPATKVDAKSVAAAAQKAIDDANSGSAVRTLSDIPGGIGAESDEIAQLGLMSAADLGNKFMSMPTDKLMAILAKAA